LVKTSRPDRTAYPKPRGLWERMHRIRSSPAAAPAMAAAVPSLEASSTTISS
jgi:hypothetical protein